MVFYTNEKQYLTRYQVSPFTETNSWNLPRCSLLLLPEGAPDPKPRGRIVIQKPNWLRVSPARATLYGLFLSLRSKAPQLHCVQTNSFMKKPSLISINQLLFGLRFWVGASIRQFSTRTSFLAYQLHHAGLEPGSRTSTSTSILTGCTCGR